MAIIIDKSQYRNFSCKLGKKNKITKVKGNEYIIDASATTSYEEGNKEFALNSIPNDITQTNADDGTNAHYTAFALFDWNADYYLRQEVHSKVIKYRFVVTGKTITNLNQLTAKYTLFYKEYTNTSQLVNSSNYNSGYSNDVFSSMRTNGNRPSSAYDSNTQEYSEYDGSTSSTIKTYVASGYYDNISDGLSDTIGYAYPRYLPTHYCNVNFISKTKNQDGVNFDYTFEVEMQFTYLTAANHVAVNSWTGNISAHKNYCCEVVKVQIEVSGYTVQKEEIVSEYCPSGDDKYILELQTNELMQQSIEYVPVGTEQKVISFSDVASEIINAYKDNRLIITFDLINNKRYDIDGVVRYLEAGDRIKIKDIDDNYISSQGTGNGNEFEIIKANSKWDGFYYKEITAKEILTPTTSPVETRYGIFYDTLGNGSVSSIVLNCTNSAVAGEQVNFTISMLDVTLEVTNVVLQDNNSGDDINGLLKDGDTYSFTMPPYEVNIMIYLMEK